MSETMELVERSPLYRKRYGAWAGFPSGHAPDYSRCCESVVPPGRGVIARQCSKKRGHGPDGAYCTSHNPEAAKRRDEERSRKHAEETKRLRYQWSGRQFYEVLKQIAEGHNDPRALARETLKKFHRDDT